MAKSTYRTITCFVLSLVFYILGCSQQLQPYKVARLESSVIERIITLTSQPVYDLYTKSSKTTKQELLPDLLNALSAIKWNKFIQGWAILSLDGDIVFQAGKAGHHIISAEICTIKGILTRYEGYCFSDLVLYINKKKLKEKIPNIEINCTDCLYPLFSAIRDTHLKIHSNIYIKCPECI